MTVFTDTDTDNANECQKSYYIYIFSYHFGCTSKAIYDTEGNNMVKYRVTVLSKTDTDNPYEYQKYYAMYLLLPICMYVKGKLRYGMK